MKFRDFSRFARVVFVWAVFSSQARAVTLQGQVTNAVTGEPLTGAVIAVDAEPADGTPEFSVVSDVFGFYEARDVPAAAQRLRVSLGGYEAAVRGVAATGTTMNENFALTPLPGVTSVDLILGVVDAASNHRLPGIPVEIIRYDSATDLTPDPPFTVVTDETGNYSLFGAVAGHYTFSFNAGAQRRPGWESYPKAGGHTAKMAVSSPHQAALMLKHVPQTIKLRVEGMDPVTEEVGPLKSMVVELTGVSPDNSELVLIPPREMATNEAGEVSFHNLMPIHWRARIKRPGYELTDVFLEPDPVTDDLPGRQPGAAEVLNAVIEPTAMKLTLASVYDVGAFSYYEGIEVRIEGVANTNAEGITRVLDTGDLENERIFLNLLPGRYEARVNDRFEPDDPETTPSPHFHAEETFDLVEGETTEEELLLEVRRAIVRARLFKADQIGNMNTGGGNDYVLTRPVYVPHEAEDVLMGIEDDTVTGKADENGDVVFVVYPGLYGFAVPSMTDYLGSHILVQNDLAADPHRQGWPTLSGLTSPAPPGAEQGEPLVINSDHEYRIDLYTHKKGTTLALDVVVSGDNPTRDIVTAIPVPFSAPQTTVFIEPLAIPAGFEITESGTSQVIPGNILLRGGRLVVEFPDVTPGTWTWTGTHPRYDIETFPLPGSTPETVTIPELPEYPGADHPPPAGPPGIFSFYNPVLMYQTWPSAMPATATYKATPAFTLLRKVWDEEAEPPQYFDAGTDTSPVFDFIRPAYAGGALFAATGRPLGSFDLWKRDPTGQWFAASVAGSSAEELTIFVGGPQNNVSLNPPSMTANITLKAVSREAPDVEIPGIEFHLGGSVFVSGMIGVPGLYSGPIALSTATDPAGKWLYKGQNIFTSGAFNNDVLIVAEMGRALTISGTVKVDNAAAEPIPGAKVRLRDRFGDARFPAKITDADGAFLMPPTFETPAFFVDVSAPGFKPRRLRFGGADPAIGGTGNNGTLELDLRLEPLPAPVVEAVIDRHGLFLSNVSFSSKGSLTELGRAVDELTATWTATVTPPAPAFHEELNFDNPDGTPGEVSQRVFTDDIALVAMVDPRLFPPESSVAAGTGGAGTEQEGMFDYDPDPDPAKVLARRKWWGSITSQTYTDGAGDDLPGYHVIYKLAETFMEDPVTGVVTATGKQKLWTLPPGRFSPVIVVETKHGALGIHQILYEGVEEDKTLRALRPPAWLAAIADALALTKKFAGSPLLQQRALDKSISGRFRPKRITNGLISLGTPGSDTEGFLKYAYNGNTQWNEGQKGAASGFLSYATDTVGGAFEAALEATVDGKDGTVLLEIRGTATPDSVDTNLFKPAHLTQRQKERIENKAFLIGSASLSNGFAFDKEADPLEMLTSSRFLFGIGLESRYDLTPYFKLIPYVGPVVRLVDKASGKKLQMDAVARLASSFDVLSTWTTRWPRIVEGGGSGVPGSFPHPELGHYLGGRAVAQPGLPASTFSQTKSLLLHFGVGVEIALGEVAGGSLFMTLQGSKVKIPIAEGEDLPAVQAIFNPDETWPVIKEVKGELKLNAQLFADIVITRLEKNWSLTVPFRHQFGTESQFDLIPMTVTFSSRSLADAPPATWLGASPQLVSGIFGSARDMHRIAAGSPDVMIFPDIDPVTGRMLLRAATRISETAWGEPVILGDEDGIVASDVARLSNGTLLAVWTAIAGADLGSPGAASTIRFATSTDGGATWSAPATAATLAGVADTLHLETSGTFQALIYLTREGAAGSPLQSISGMTYSTSTGWAAPTELVPAGEILSLDATGVGAAVTVAYTTDTDQLKVFSWSGGAPGAIATGAALVKPGVTVIDSGGLAMIFSLPLTGGLRPLSFFAGSLLAGAVVYPDEEPDGVSGIAVGGSPERILVAWSDAPEGDLRYALLSTTGAAVSPEPVLVTRNLVGRHTVVDAVQSPAGHATIFTRFHAPGAQPELRQFIVSRTDGLVFTDRDGDGIHDIDELLIVDADPGDLILTIDDVTAGPSGSDFDNDGVSDADEITGGTDPTDPRSRPLPPGVNLVATFPTAQEFGLIPGQFQISRSDATLPVDVLFSISGTATEGEDFQITAAPPLHFEADVTTLTVDVLPLADSLPEGAETIILTLLPDAAYTLGTQTEATVTLRDRPSDGWRLAHFPANPGTVSFDGDTDGDGLSELAEFGLALDPNSPQVGGLPVAGRTADGDFLTLTYTRPLESDLIHTVQVSEDGANWRSGGLHTTEVSREHHDNGTETVVIRSNTPLTSVARQLIRLAIRQP